MSKTKIEAIKKYLEDIEILKDVAKDLQKEVIQQARKDYREIKLNTRLSHQGQVIEMEEARKHYAEAFLKSMQDINRMYDLNVKSLKTLSQEVLASPNEFNGTDAQKASFELSLRDLQTRVMLHPDSNKAVELVEDFVRKQDNPYFAQQVAHQFPTLVASLATVSNGDLKSRLTHAYQTAQRKAVTEDKVLAQQAIELSDKPNLVLTINDAPSFANLRNVIGKQAASSANNPDEHLVRMAEGTEQKEVFTYGEVKEPTFNEGE